MQPEQQQRIMGYFIEEAKDHLNTIEQGLLNLQSTMEDTEMVNEVFRAAHSVKGGAAMLGFNSIQKTAHRLEDCFKVLKESPVKADHQLESLFLQVFDTLQALVEQLQGPFGLTDEAANTIMAEAEPVFEELNNYLGQLVKKAEDSTSFATAETSLPVEVHTSAAVHHAPLVANASFSQDPIEVVPESFRRDVLVELREMLQLFKQADLPECREALQEHCRFLAHLGEQLDLPGWSELLESSQNAIACEDNSFRLLASLVIKEIKQAQELVMAGRSVEIAPSEQLQALVPAASVETTLDSDLSATSLFDDLDSPIQEQHNFIEAEDTSANQYESLPEIQQDSWFTSSSSPQSRSGANFSFRTTSTTSSPGEPSDPEVGMAELNSLADIFEGQTPDLDQTWQEEEIISFNDRQPRPAQDSSFTWDDNPYEIPSEGNDFADLMGDLNDLELSTTEASTHEDLRDWLGDDASVEVTLQEDLAPLSNDYSESSLSATDDFSDLLFEADSSDLLATSSTSSDDLNSLFGDSFFEENAPVSQNPEEFVFDAEAMTERQPQDDDFFAMPAVEGFDEADALGLEDAGLLSVDDEEFLSEAFIGDEDNALTFEDSAWELEDIGNDELQLDEVSFTESELDLGDWLESSEREAANLSENDLGFGEELVIDDEQSDSLFETTPEETTLGSFEEPFDFDELAFDESANNFNLSADEDFDLGGFDTQSDISANPSAQQPDLSLDESLWDTPTIDELSTPQAESLLEESLLDVDEPEFTLDELSTAGMNADFIDFDLDETPANALNLDETSEGDLDNWFGTEAPLVAEASENEAFDSLETSEDWLESQTTETEALGLEEFNLSSLEELDANPSFNSLDDLFDTDPEATETSAANNILEFEDFSSTEASATTDSWDSELEEASIMSFIDNFADISEFNDEELFEQETTETNQVTDSDISLNWQESDIDSLLGDEASEDIEPLDFASVDVDSLNLEEDFVSTTSAEGFRFEEMPGDSEALDFASADLELFNLEEDFATEASAEGFRFEEAPEDALEDIDALDFASVDVDSLNLEEDFGSTTSAEGFRFEEIPGDSEALDFASADMALNLEEEFGSEASTEELNFEEAPADSEALDFASADLEPFNLEGDFGSEVSAEGFSFEEMSADSEALDFASADLEPFNLEGDFGSEVSAEGFSFEEMSGDSEALDFASADMALNLEEDFGSEASTEGFSFDEVPADSEALDFASADLEPFNLEGDFGSEVSAEGFSFEEMPGDNKALDFASADLEALNFEEDLGTEASAQELSFDEALGDSEALDFASADMALNLEEDFGSEASTEELNFEEAPADSEALDFASADLEPFNLEGDFATEASAEGFSFDEVPADIDALDFASADVEPFNLEGDFATEASAEGFSFDEVPADIDALDFASADVEPFNLDEDFGSEASAEGFSFDEVPADSEALDFASADLEPFNLEGDFATEASAEGFSFEEAPADIDALDFASADLEPFNLDEDFGSEASSEGFSFDEVLADSEALDFASADLEPFNLEGDFGSEVSAEGFSFDEAPADSEALDFASADLEALNFEEDLGTEASAQELNFDVEAEEIVEPQAAMFEWETAETTEAVDSESFATSPVSELEALLGTGESEEADALNVLEEGLFETEAASDWELAPVEEEAIDDFLDWQGTDAVETTENLEDFLGVEADNLTVPEDWEEMDTDQGSLELWDVETEEDLNTALGLEWETAESDERPEAAQTPALPEVLATETSADGWADLDSLLGEGSEGEAQLDDFAFLNEQEEDPSLTAEFDSFESASEVTSSLESEFDDLEALLTEEALPAPALASSNLDAFDDLELLLEDINTAEQSSAPVTSKAPETDSLDDEFGDLEKLLEQADQTMGGPQKAIADQRQARSVIRPRNGARLFEQTMRVPVKHLDSLSNLVGELVVNRNSLEQDQERLRQFLDNLSHQVLALSDVGARMQDLYERSLLETSLLSSRPGQRSSFHSDRAPNNNSSGMEYDPLEMDRFTGFHLLSQEMIELIVRVRESASDIEFLVDETDQVARMLRQVTTQLQEGLTRGRMVPFAQTADRLFRAVREISLKLNKEAQLHVEGRETLIDKMILEHLSDPMVHLVNNALTHGIEPPEVRKAAGKPTAGQITLRASQQGNQTVISVSDDGAGIDPELVRRKAVEQKLISRANAKNLTNLDLYDFLFHPGFTTKDKEDEYAGRGVGMDVVRTSLSEIRGAIHIDSALGKGTTFTIRLPLTLSICKALCCLSAHARLAFPMDGVEDMLDVPCDRIQTNAEGQTCIQWRDTLLAFQPLSELLSYNRQINRATVYGGKREDDMISIVVLRSSSNFIAIQVDQVLGEQEIVIKQLEGPAPKPIGIAGATVLGDGRIMPIADVLELIDLSMGRIRKDGVTTLWSRDESSAQPPEDVPPVKAEPMVLIVDDSITVRELLSMTFTKAGYRVEQARDGQEAWDKLRSGLPCDIVFCDIEMPRMDGLELLSRLQKDENLQHLPIAMLTSRGADRHRQMASQLGASGYFTKPYLEEVLLEAAQRMIKGEVLFGSSSNA
ncbi:response regulator [Microcoleus sp. FACHB-SPT15]|uniref:hybrid sensor histidine kinase/response regulator n=1 Tax=Microcoleus sp. FACHB-SPT15 TaxID=2692830 RepID=UPI001783A2E8|nr:response regulator [Microcoleus sp. FACHB-SPT15]MBD1809633.1 response regulator [Microcoleus sp. FACHB-SPT15]